jgi:4-amino-4-deoxy-L-arabinose transferase-like glycosyltransferase
MTGQAGQFQPDGQVLRRPGRRSSGLLRISWWLGLASAVVLLCISFNRGGLWDPYELRNAELARRLAHQIFGVNLSQLGTEQNAYVTWRQLAQGELSVTSPAFGFAVFGVSDWAGRLPSLVWGVLAILSTWVVMGRLVGRLAQVMSVLILATLPLFAWQSRTILGDAATMGTLALATSGLMLACIDERPGSKPTRWFSQLLFWSMAVIGLGAGILCRGILVGVSVPTLSVGLGCLFGRASIGTSLVRNLRAAMLIGVGLISAVIGVREVSIAPRGFSLLLGATLSATRQSSPFDMAMANLLHQTFPLSAFLPVACAIALKRPRSDAETSGRERIVARVLTFTVVLCLATCALMLTRGVSIPFPAVMALSGLSGLAIVRLHRQDGMSALSGAIVLTFAVLLFADFTNMPEKVLLTTGVVGAPFPETFVAEGQLWLRMALAILGWGSACIAVANGLRAARRIGTRERYRALFERIHSAFGGQLVGGFVLVETALVTTSLLQRAHDQGWISVPAFDVVQRLVGPLLSWAWVVPPVVLILVPLGYTTLEVVVQWLTMTGPRVVSHAQGRFVHAVGAHGSRGLPWDRIRVSPGLMAGLTLVASGFVICNCHAPALAEQLSPKRAFLNYASHAGSDDSIALLGIKPESAGYYLGAEPKSFQDVEAAAKWLQSSGNQRRWLTFGTDHLAELNAAFRAAAAGRNLVIVDPLGGNVLLATNRLEGTERDFNPLGADILAHPPPTAHAGTTEFGGVLRLVGWDIKSNSGGSVSTLRAGRVYELNFVFQVLGTTNVDWQVFVHLDGGGRRHNGDHDPVVGRYPTTLWQPGDVVVDRHQMVLERGAVPGPHTLFMGLFRGNRRLEVTAGSHEDNRVKLGELEVK